MSENRKFVFVSNPKSGSTSIEAALSPYQDRPYLNQYERVGYYTKGHLPAIELVSILGAARWAGYNSFAIVREPYSWFLSQVAYNVLIKGDLMLDLVNPLDDSAVGECYAWFERYRGQEASPSATQWAFVCDQHRQPLVATLWQFEGLSLSWPEVCRSLRIRADPLPKLNPSSARGGPTPRLAPSGRAAVADLYATDFELHRAAVGGSP